jgi:hypothetical protein
LAVRACEQRDRWSVRIGVVGVTACLAVGGALAGVAGASDASTIKPLVITQADVGAGYAASPGSSDNTTFAKLAACVGKPTKNRKVSASVDGPDLANQTTGVTIQSSTDIVKTTAMAKADQAVLANPKFADCISQVAQTALAAQGVTSVQSQHTTVPKYGNYSTAVITQAQGTSNGAPFTVTVVQVGIIKGRAEFSASFVTPTGQPFDQTQGQAILAKLNQRLKKAKT